MNSTKMPVKYLHSNDPAKLITYIFLHFTEIDDDSSFDDSDSEMPPQTKKKKSLGENLIF